MAAMKEDPTVSALLTNGKALQGFLDLYLQNSPQACDYGLWWWQESSVKIMSDFSFTNTSNNML